VREGGKVDFCFAVGLTLLFATAVFCYGVLLWCSAVLCSVLFCGMRREKGEGEEKKKKRSKDSVSVLLLFLPAVYSLL